jgi:heme/copper-type cytochrome/quinol oxidase subunit 2
MRLFSITFLLTITALSASYAVAAEVPEYSLSLKDHTYIPTELKIPANTKVRIKVTNQDTTPEEFESTEFNRESIVLPGQTIDVFVGPLKAGTYRFFGDFHQDTAQGRLVVE